MLLCVVLVQCGWSHAVAVGPHHRPTMQHIDRRDEYSDSEVLCYDARHLRRRTFSHQTRHDGYVLLSLPRFYHEKAPPYPTRVAAHTATTVEYQG